MIHEQYPNAYQLLGGYFHQDFSLEFSEPEKAIENFISESSKTDRALIVRELKTILARHDDATLDKLIYDLGCYYSPKKHRGIGTAKWLEDVADMLEKSLETKPENPLG